MTRRHPRHLTSLLVTALVGFSAGCATGNDDEMAPPPSPVTSAPSASPIAGPTVLPVGNGKVTRADTVWAQGGLLHVDRRSVDLSPVRIDAFVVTGGGVYLLSNGELWFTDLSRLRGTGLTGVSSLGVTADGARLLVTTDAATDAYDTRTGRSVSSEGLEPLSAQQRLGTAVGVDTDGTRVIVRPTGKGRLSGRTGSGRFGVALTRVGTPVAFDTGTGQRVRLRGTVPRNLELAGWTTPVSFYGLAGRRGATMSVVSCNVRTRICVSLGRVIGTDPVLFGTGLSS